MRRSNISHDEYERYVKTVANLLLYRAAEDLPLEDHDVPRKGGDPYRERVVTVPIVLVPVMRAGLPMEEEVERYFSSASVGFIEAERDEGSGQAWVPSCKLPLLKGAKTFLMEQVVATGDTVCKVLEVIKGEYQAEDVILFCCIAAPQGISRIFAEHPELKIFLGHLDETLDDNYFVYPGIGDAGDRTFGIYHKPNE